MRLTYQREKEILLKQRKKRWRIVALIVALLLSVVILFSLVVLPAEYWKYYVKLPKISKRKAGEMRLHFLDVGQGDSIFIELPDGKKMLVDGGNGTGKTAKTVLRYLNALDVKKIDYLVCTHSDSDHSGSLDLVVKQKKIGTAFIPAIDDYTINDEYAQFYAALKKKSVKIEESRSLFSLSTEKYGLVFLSPYSRETEDGQYDEVNDGKYGSEDLNDTSAVIWLKYNGVGALLVGDATERVEKTVVRDYLMGVYEEVGVELEDTQILKVSHHGGDGATGNALLATLNAETAVISVGKDNTYGHPTQATVDRLTEFGVNTYRTDEKGTVRITVTKEGTYTIKTTR